MYPIFMRKPAAALLTLLLLLPSVQRARAQAYTAKPKLAVILIIDQFRGDYLDRYRDQFHTENGFNLFLKKGVYFNSCYFDYANTKTAPGHATIGTGAYTDGHGIGSNEWWDLARNTDHTISSVEDERYALVGTFDDLPPPAAPRIGSSPRNEHATTIGDEVRLATNGQSKLYGVSLKDRAAILPSGQTANGAFWIDSATGRFVTSTYYMPQLPDWATKFNKGPRVAAAVKAAGLDDTNQFYAKVGRTPAANSYELDFARELINNEKLGQHPVTDVLTISLSANDILGHQVGPDADAQKEMVLQLDRDLDSFFTYLDKRLGLANVMVAFTADHGISPIPTESAKLGIASASLDLKAFTRNIETTLNQRFHTENKKFLFPNQELPYLALDPRAFAALTPAVSEKDAEQAMVDAIPAALRSLAAPPASPNTAAAPARLDADPALAFVRSRLDLAAGDKVPPTEFGRLINHSYTANGGWYVMVVPTPYQMEYLSGIQTTHFSPWSYDRHVPLGFYGPEFVPGYYRDQVAPVDIAATFASLLGVNAPSNNIGHVLTQVLRPQSR